MAEEDPCVVLGTFLAKSNEDITLLIGIDPGATGAIAVRDANGRRACVVDIPTVKVGVKRSKKTSAKEMAETGHKTKTVAGTTTKFDHGGICDLFKLLRPFRENAVVILEAVPSSMGPADANKPGRRNGEAILNRAFAMWPLFLYSKGFNVEEVAPNKWKPKMGLGPDKEVARLKALSLFPRAAITRKSDHNRAEALLLTEYFLRSKS